MRDMGEARRTITRSRQTAGRRDVERRDCLRFVTKSAYGASLSPVLLLDSLFMGPSSETSRREALAALAGVATLAVATQDKLSHVASLTGVAKGCVFDDRRGDGIRRPGDVGLAGVMVSNGRDVTLTRPDGSWVLSVEPGDSVFVVKPPHWATPIDSRGLPSCSYLYHPLGAPPGLTFRGVEPSGALPPSIDFALRRQIESTRFDALLVADTQPGSSEELGFVRDEVIAATVDSGAAFAIHHGDVMGDDLSLLPRYLAMLGVSEMPWHHCPGNHDFNLDSQESRYGLETWKRFFGPTNYAFQYGQATFFVLNNVAFAEKDGAAPGERPYRGRIGERQLAFVANVLQHVPMDHLIVVSLHIPLVNFEDPKNPSDNTSDRRQLLELLSSRPHSVSFAGHSHTTEHHYLGDDHGFSRAEPHHHHILTAACGSWWGGPFDPSGVPISDSRDGTPRGMHILSVDGNRYTTRFLAARGGARSQMRILLVGAREGLRVCPVSAGQLADLQLVVDMFDGGPRTTASFSIEGVREPPQAMQRIAMADPFIVRTFSRDPASRKAWVEAALSSHLFAASLPTGMTPGAYRLRVHAKGEYGFEITGDMVLEVSA